jgi:hypothetical protein
MHYPNSFFQISFLTLALLFLSSCQQNHSDAPIFGAAEKNASPADSYAEAEGGNPKGTTAQLEQSAFQTASAAVNKWDAVKKLVRRAELSFRTQNVIQTTLAIEDIVRANGGFILENNLSQTEEQQFTTPLSRDSLLETTVSRISNRLVLRVPVAQLDTTIRAIGRWSAHVEYRNITAEDVGLKWLEEQLEQLRNNQYQTELQRDITHSPTKLQDVSQAREKALAGRAAADAAMLEQARLDDAIQLSTISIVLSQRPITTKEVLARTAPVTAWTPGLQVQLKEAFFVGWHGIQNLLLLLVTLWPVLLFGTGLWWFFRKRKLLPALRK